ncbi:MAG: PAS domain-containing protein [Betaproteobacteria bacterium]
MGLQMIIRNLFDCLSEGLLIISARSGNVTYANPTAISMLQISDISKFNGEWLDHQVIAIQRGYLKLPARFEINGPAVRAQPERIQVTLVPSPLDSDIVAVMKDLTSEKSLENMVDNLAEVLDCEFQVPMRDFLNAVVEMLSRFSPAAEESFLLRESVANVVRMGTSLEGKLAQLSLLASTFKASPMLGAERIEVYSLINEVIQSMQTTIGERRVRISFSGISESLPIIYGSKTFLVKAIEGYLRHLINNVEPGIRILIAAKTTGNFIQISISNYGKDPVNPSQKVIPALFASSYSNDNKLEALGLTLPLCNRVIELHKGNVRLDEAEAGFSKIMFELPVGAPKINDEEMGIKQAQRYAHDLISLMKRKSNKEGAGL